MVMMMKLFAFIIIGIRNCYKNWDMIKYYFDVMLLPTPQLSVTDLFADEVCRERKKFENRICYAFVGFGNNSRKTILDP